MSSSNKTEKICNMAKDKAAHRQKEVLNYIKQMANKAEKITFYSVAKATGASKSYLYKNEIISKEICKYRDATSTPRTKDSDKVIIQSLRLEIRTLKTKCETLEKANGESYKEKYEKMRKDNEELKRQLESAYTAW